MSEGGGQATRRCIVFWQREEGQKHPPRQLEHRAALSGAHWTGGEFFYWLSGESTPTTSAWTYAQRMRRRGGHPCRQRHR